METFFNATIYTNDDKKDNDFNTSGNDQHSTASNTTTNISNHPTQPIQNNLHSSLSTLLQCNDTHPSTLLCKHIRDERDSRDHATLLTLQLHRAQALERAARPSDLYTIPDIHNTSSKTENNTTSMQLHPLLVPMQSNYSPRVKWRHWAAPGVNIVGLPKAGTSQLYNVLISHRHAIHYGPYKEFCLFSWEPLELYRDLFWYEDLVPPSAEDITQSRDLVQKSLYQFHEKVYQFLKKRNLTSAAPFSALHTPPTLAMEEHGNNLLHTSDRLLTVNACNSYWAFELTWRYLRPLSTTHKYIFLLRDPADWLWAAWNFWHVPIMDHVPVQWDSDGYPDWAKPGQHYRSPEFFHELVASGPRTYAGRYLTMLRHRTIQQARKLVAMVGRDNVLFVKNEDMIPTVVNTPGGLLDRLSEFLQLDRSLFEASAYQGIANCNASPYGIKDATHKCGSVPNNAYRIAGGRSILPETRVLVYYQFWEECKVWRDEFGIDYEPCINVIQDTKSVGLPPRTSPPNDPIQRDQQELPAFYNYNDNIHSPYTNKWIPLRNGTY
jgi:hypothetical protein